jgi:hypothetical protein
LRLARKHAPKIKIPEYFDNGNIASILCALPHPQRVTSSPQSTI